MDNIELVVLTITDGVERASGDPLHLVEFGQYVTATPEVLARFDSKGMKRISAKWLDLFYKGEPVPYVVGSKWKLTVSDDGSLSLVKAK